MKARDLDFSYPEELVATHPQKNFRILLSQAADTPQEISLENLFDLFQSGDVLVINDTQVLPRRIFTDTNQEVLFLNPSRSDPACWQVLFSARELKIGDRVRLPGDGEMELTKKGLPQEIKIIRGELSEDYFARHAELALPPYIQKARQQRKPLAEDKDWYQTDWAENKGSLAAPTASLHFSNADLRTLEAKGVVIAKLTLHVGIGTFLPIKTENLDAHIMHKEQVHIPGTTLTHIQKARRVWALGTTAVRALESWAQGKLSTDEDGNVFGETDLFIQPGYKFSVVNGLLTNFHQPESSLLALVSAFAGLSRVQKAYGYAIDKKFRLFSYGDLSIWINQ